MANKQDYYELLGVSRTASKSEIKKAYRKLAMEHHPDRNDGEDTQFKTIQEAYAVLSDTGKRQSYDQFGHAGVDGSGFGGFGGFSAEGGVGDVFDMFFGGRGAAGRSSVSRGRDLEYLLQISFEDSIFGGERKITFNRQQTCTRCKGSGGDPDAKVDTCNTCKGAGQLRQIRQTMLGQMVQSSTCPTCKGRGKTYAKQCTQCHGIGSEQMESKLKLNIPPGVEHGNRLRLSGEGEAGAQGGPAGDLFVVFDVAPHKLFSRQGLDIHYHLELDYLQLVLGDEVQVPTVYGDEALKISAGTQPDKIFRLKSKGAPAVNGTRVGDEIVSLSVRVPKSLTDGERDLLLSLAKERGLEISPTDPSFMERLKEGLGMGRA